VNGVRPSSAWTTRVLSTGTLLAAGCLAVGFGLNLLAFPELATPFSLAGVVVLLATPPAGLVATYVELRVLQPRTARAALLVLAILAFACVAALVNR
jgi:hypothetical protein